MKRLFKSISKKVFVLGLLSAPLLTSPVSASDYYGIVKDVSGTVFLSVGERTVPAKVGTKIFDSTEVMTTSGAQVSVMDRYDHIVNLSGSAHMAVQGKKIELIKGYLWIQSTRKRNDKFKIQTANASVSYGQGEGVISFDEATGKTQLLSIRGVFRLRHAMDQHKFEYVREGEFSFINDSYREGRPRSPTAVGYDSYQKVTNLFSGVEPIKKTFSFPQMRGAGKKAAKSNVNSGENPQMQTSKSPSRSVASEAKSDAKEGSIHYVETQSMKKSSKGKLKQYYQKQLAALEKEEKDKKQASRKSKKKGFRPSYQHKSDVTVRVFGASKESTGRMPSSEKNRKKEKKSKSKKSGRAPASLQEVNPQVNIEQDAFEKGLNEQLKKQMRHDQEVNALIKELKNYDQDYQTSY